MIKVLQFGMTSNLGGIETYIMNYYRQLDKKKIKYDFIYIYGDDRPYFEKEINNNGGIIYDVPNYYKHPIKYIKCVKKIIKQNKYDIVHCNMNSAVMIYPLIAAKLAGSKVIIAHAHNSSSDKGPVKQILHHVNKKFIRILANYYFACSEIAGKWFYNSKIRQSSNYFIIKNAVDFENFRFNLDIRKRIRNQLGLSDDDILIGHVGRFAKQKNHSFIIEIFQNINKKYPNAMLLLIGRGDLLAEIKNIIKFYGLDKNVIIIEQTEKVNEYLQAMDIFLLPSLYEGLPVVGVEAQCAGNLCYFSDSITKETKLLDKTQYLSLKDSAELWANNIIEKYMLFKDTRNNSVEKEINYAGYNINLEAQKLFELYYKLSEKNERS